MDSKKFHAKKVDSFRMRAIGRTVWAGLYYQKSHELLKIIQVGKISF